MVVVFTGLVPVLDAQGPTITASDRVFTPRDVTIAPGGSVRLDNSGGTHNFAFADGSYPSTPTASTDPVWDDLSRTFGQAGDYSFVCAAHPEMTGVVHVRDPAATPTATPTPTPTPTPQGGSADPADELEVRTLRMTAPAFCTRRGPRCARPGVRLRIDLSQPASVTGTLARRPPRGRARARSFGRVRFGSVAAGPRTLSFTRNAAGRRLTAGRYTLKVAIADRAPQPLAFRVR